MRPPPMLKANNPSAHRINRMMATVNSMGSSLSFSRAAYCIPADHVRGSPFAKVTLVGYGDFACPECAKIYRTVKTIQKKVGARLRYVFRSFPQPDKNSEKAAEAAECASSLTGERSAPAGKPAFAAASFERRCFS